MPFASVRDVSIYYERLGSGPPLLFITGTGSDLRVRPGVQDGAFPKRFDMVCFDQRGLGQSSKPDEPYGMADYADDAAALMEHLGWDSAHVIGVSFGGMVAQEFALRYPKRVRRLALCCTSPGGAGGSSFPFHEIDHLAGEARARHLLPISDTRWDAAWQAANPEQTANLIAMASADRFGDEPGHAMGARRQLEARAAHDVWDRLSSLEAPVLIAAGAYDGIAPLDTQRRLAARIPNARLEIFEGGHMFLIQDRRAAGAIGDFLLETV